MTGDLVNPMANASGGGSDAAHGPALAVERARALGAFLRARRESLDPARLGVPRVGRRRTPGLRREEVAALADVGVTWYTWLEQGRPVRASARVLTAIATALQCSDVETGHVLALAGLGDAAPRLQPPCERLTDTGRMLLDQLGPWPAMLQSPRFDILGANPAFERLMGVTLAELPEADRNCVYQAFTNPHWRARLVDQDNVLQHMVALLRAAMGEHLGEPAWERLLARYRAASPEFDDLWQQRREVRGVENQLKRFHHPQLGELQLQQVNWWSAPRNGNRLVVYLPADEAARAALLQLHAQSTEVAAPAQRH
ncbi:helix-turn-helix transcriptional regulator [Xanthomonas tesorieronis]|uniref:helix-turn-helix transcriptional regulator n=1 Tax=Xanthomonas tesorieronis TaxID=3160839 RepID=UPI003517937F